MLRLLVAAAITATTVAGPPAEGAAAQTASDPKTFIDNLGASVLDIIRSPNLTQAQRRDQFRTLFSDSFDVPTIGRFVVGRYWNRASPDEQQKYLDTFRNYVAAIYADQFSHYQGEAFKTTAARPLGADENLVTAQIERPSQPPISVQFRVKGSPGAYKIDDVTVENVSLIVTKRDEFSSLLERSGLKGVTDRMQAALDTQNAGT
ncbi:MAG: ABC transporter substrate-binding protein [Alphaproteobacteria bacterium]|nr:ABC transporter substrate-binding protein [Alphaproteobacteria bacterium]